jgi:hypothetical protein
MLESVLQGKLFVEFSNSLLKELKDRESFAQRILRMNFDHLYGIEEDRGCDIGIAEFIEKGFLERRLMHNCNHPGSEVMGELANLLLGRINGPGETLEAWDLFPRHDCVIYDVWAERIGLSFATPKDEVEKRYQKYLAIVASLTPEQKVIVEQSLTQHLKATKWML